MISSDNAVTLSRVLVPLSCLVVWGLSFQNARCAYRLQKGWKKAMTQLSLLFGAVAVCALQVYWISCFMLEDDFGQYLPKFIIVEWGGALVVLFYTLLRERSKSRMPHP
jgi:hypothetical protein